MNGMDFFVCVIGMVMIIEGLPYFIAPEKMQEWLTLLTEILPQSLRRTGLFLILSGLLLVYLGRH